MKRLGCKKVSEEAIRVIKEETQLFIRERNRIPTLAVILVGSDPASQTYVKNKALRAEECGFKHFQYNLCEDCKESELLSLITTLNNDKGVDGILVQLPLPKTINTDRVIDHIAPEKDVDGFCSVNVGRLCQGKDAFIPCTPLGIIEILSYYQVETRGKNIVIIGRSNIVGRPMAMLLSQRGLDGTVTICHSATANLKDYTTRADIVIVATGHPNTIDSSFVKDGAVIIDVGINRIPDSASERGFKLVGDVDYASLKDREVSVTPVPGGVGLMTVAMLMKNTLKAAKKRDEIGE